MFACLIICTFQLVFSVGTMFFSHSKLARIVFWFIFSTKQTGPYLVKVKSFDLENKNDTYFGTEKV